MNTKSHLLALLEKNRGQNISGEFIAREIGVSRAAVWKAVKELEKDGYKIAAATKKGYRLEEDNDILSAQGITAHLNFKAPPEISIHAEAESTNILAKQAAVSGAEHFTIILAERQTAGKGRRGKSFFSPPGCGIYMSFVLRPPMIWLDVPTLITVFAAVAVCEAIETVCGKHAKIKWVNDIFLGGKKICGISNEAGTDFQSGEVSWIVTGIGVNFRAPEGGFPEEIRQIAGAVYDNPDETPPVTRNCLAAEIIKNMSRISGSKSFDFLEKYRSLQMLLGEKITIHGTATPEITTATALDIDACGQLVVQTESGEIISLSSGEVSVRGP
ncbi:MAG: biotin--[acetyl-CoA-carboxylase] ligase [Defluviitaleaceae bacterium]|nr:biotin--[acetyl-CoA-carboxylase] ligase [Defluviitaleaceae bacterium]